MQKAATVFRANEVNIWRAVAPLLQVARLCQPQVCQVLLAIPAAEASLVNQVSQAALAPMAEMDALVLQDGMGRPAPEAPLVHQVIQVRSSFGSCLWLCFVFTKRVR